VERPAAADTAPLRSPRPRPRPRGDAQDDSAQLLDCVSAAQGGDERAFEQVYLLVQPRLLRYLRVMVGDDAEDVASETWAQVCRDLHSFAGDGDGFRGWVATVGRHRALDHIRSSSRHPAIPVPIQDLTFVPGVEDTEVKTLEALSTEAAVSLIGTLPQDQAEAVMLRAVLGLDAKTAAQVLGKRPGAVRTAAYRGLQTLASRLDATRPR
jgi:RNA polymerase sigma-70 factor (ECF subfamily)